MSGRGTADEISRSYRTGKRRSLWRIASLAFLGSLMAVGLFVALAPLPASADDNEESRHGREDNDRGIRAEIAAVQATVSALQRQVNTLQTANADLQNEVNGLQTSNAKLQSQVNSLEASNTKLQRQLTAIQSNHALALGPFVSVDPNPEIGVVGPNITFSGANIHIVSGSGSTDDGMLNNPNATLSGLGNLIIGYDEDPGKAPGGPEAPPPTLGPGDRSGSHNLVIGRWNRFTKAAFGGLVAGELNLISNEGASVSGGELNTTSGFDASVSGGTFNTASGFDASVLGGYANTASGFFASVSGGDTNTASGLDASVSGGFVNTAGGQATSVIGGAKVIDNNNNSIAPQPPFP
jgi:FtsZ-binding cell division protein ZapB